MGWVRSDDADELRGVHPLKMPQTCAELCPSESSASSAFNGSSCCDWKQRHLHVLTPWLYLCNMTTFRHHNGELVDRLSTAKSQHDVHRISQVRSSLLRTFGRRQGPINRCPACVHCRTERISSPYACLPFLESSMQVLPHGYTQGWHTYSLNIGCPTESAISASARRLNTFAAWLQITCVHAMWAWMDCRKTCLANIST